MKPGVERRKHAYKKTHTSEYDAKKWGERFGNGAESGGGGKGEWEDGSTVIGKRKAFRYFSYSRTPPFLRRLLRRIDRAKWKTMPFRTHEAAAEPQLGARRWGSGSERSARKYDQVGHLEFSPQPSPSHFRLLPSNTKTPIRGATFRQQPSSLLIKLTQPTPKTRHRVSLHIPINSIRYVRALLLLVHLFFFQSRIWSSTKKKHFSKSTYLCEFYY